VFLVLGRRLIRTPLHPARVGRAWGPGRLERLWRLRRPGRLGLVRAAECPYLGHGALGCKGRGRVRRMRQVAAVARRHLSARTVCPRDEPRGAPSPLLAQTASARARPAPCLAPAVLSRRSPRWAES
jgi:hypothetical protein